MLHFLQVGLPVISLLTLTDQNIIMRSLSMLACCLLSTALSFAAGHPEMRNDEIRLEAVTVRTSDDILSRAAAGPDRQECFMGRYYCLLQFDHPLTLQEQESVKAAGIRLEGYVPFNAWMASVPVGIPAGTLTALPLRTILPVPSEAKLNKSIRYGDIPAHARKLAGYTDVTVLLFSDADMAAAVEVLNGPLKCVILEQPVKNMLTLRVPDDRIAALAHYPFVRYVQPVDGPPVPDDTKGRSLHRSNAVNVEMVFGRHYSGDSVTISLADDGEVGPHIDFKGRMISLMTGAGGNHGDMTSGIAVGAGNLDPTIRGMAEGATIVVHDIGAGTNGYDHIYNSPSFYTQYGAVITSTSYSQGCNDYETRAQTIDQLAGANPQLLYVFSGGNRGTNDCGYGAGAGWGNITGGMKIGKNVVACANMDQSGVIDPTSSRGPADDGRIKPDISANGTDQLSTDEGNIYQVGGGTSAASPGIAGVAAQLYQAYRNGYGGSNPDAALIKALLLNSADDAGNPGPDYTYGFGQVNALRSALSLESGRFLLDSLSQGDSAFHTITVPANTARLKVMVYWTDAPGDPAAAFQLVNDLDMRVSDGSAQSFSPWILDPTPNASNLSANAVRGTDHLNNVEQVTLDLPSSGTYTVRVDGSMVPAGYQKYYVVWDIVPAAITLTYPYGGEGFVPGEYERLRWDAPEDTASFSISYSADAGVSWQSIANVAGALRRFDWLVPSVSSDQVLVKVQRGSLSDMTDGFMAILPQPSNLQVDFSCVDTLQLSWTPANGISTYDVYRLGAKYMEKVATVTSNSVLLNIPSTNEEWFSVGPVGASGGSGRRINAIQKAPGLFNCTYATDLALLNTVSPAPGLLQACNNLTAIPLTVQIQNTGIASSSGASVSYSINGGTPVQDPLPGILAQGSTVSHTFSVPLNLSVAGSYSVTVTVSIPGDLNPTNDVQTFTYTPNTVTAVIPFAEDFQSGVFPPAGWSIRSSGTAYQWSLRPAVIGSSGTPTDAAWFDDYSYNNPGAEDDLILPSADLQGSANPVLTFDVAFAVYAAGYDDGLKVLVSTDCGNTFVPTGYEKIGSALATVPNSATDWFPTQASHWRNDTVDLAQWAGQQVVLKIVNINDYGNNILVDNVQLGNNPFNSISSPAAAKVLVHPNPSSGKFLLDLSAVRAEQSTLEISDAEGRLIVQQPLDGSGTGFTLDLSARAPGIYFGSITTRSGADFRFRLMRQ
jgi:subtilisin family serine protease